MATAAAEQPSLIVLTGSLAGKVFVVDDSADTVLIGSDASCRFALPGTGVAPIHARLWIDLEGITVYDTDSPRGVYINDDRVEGQARLHNGDILWLGQPGDDESVMLQCRLPGAAPPELSETAAMNAIDLDPTVSLLPEPPVVPEPTVSMEPPAAVAPEPEAYAEPEPPPLPPPSLLAPDAIQPEPTVMLAPDDAFIQPEPTVAMLPDDDELAGVDLGSEPEAEPTVAIEPVQPPPAPAPAAAGGWDATAGGITSAADAPWMAGAPATVSSFDASETIATAPPAPAPPPVPAPRSETVPVARSAAAAAAAASAAVTPRPPAPPKPPAPRAPERPPAIKPRREAKAPAAAPPPRHREPAPPPEDEDMAPPARKGAPIGLLIGGALAAAVAVAVVAWWMLSRGPAAPETGTVAPPPTIAQARPVPPPTVATPPGVSVPPPAEVPVEEEVTIVPPPRAGASPTPIPSRAPSVAPSPTQVARATPPPVTAAPAGPPPAVVSAGLVTRGEAARRSGDLDAAADLFDQALRADPQNAAATAGKAAVANARAAARKAFMPGRTVVQTQSAKADMAGFDTADVSVKKAPDFSGRIEFAVSPPRVKPGDSYSVQVFLVNEGKKAIKVSGASAITNLNGSKSPRPLSPRVKEVAPAQRALVDEIAGVWPEDAVTWWSAEVTVTANKGDSLKNTLNWK